MAGPFYEFVKVAFFKESAESKAMEAGRGAVREVAEKAKPYKKDIAGVGLGALAGRALLRRGSLGALLGLAAARHKDIGEAAKKGYGEAKKRIA